MATNARHSLVGTRQRAEADEIACVVCRADLAPAVMLIRHRPGHEMDIAARLCLPCIARAVEGATGWKIVRAWSQWLASSKLGQHLKNAEDAFNAPVQEK